MVLAALARRGFHVLVPFGEGHPYDLVIDLGGPAFLRIQCKTAWPVGGCMVFNCRTTDHGRGPRSYRGRADIFGVYFPPNQAVYLQGIRFAADYEIDRWSADSLLDIASADTRPDEAMLSVA